jgi:hypothetical protein
MKRPSALTRLLGVPLVALLLLLGCGVAVVACLQGGAPRWLGFIALLTALQSLSALGQVRRYKAWAAKWRAMGEPVNAPPHIAPKDAGGGTGRKPPSSPKRRHGRLRIVVAALLALAIPAFVGDGGDAVSSALTCLWLLACLYLAFRLLRRILRRGRKHREQAAVASKGETAMPFVTWVMDRASSSPSRAEAQRNVPDYCARLLPR